MAINEMLLQSVADVVRGFPAWPLDKPARFHQLRTQGGFLVTASCENGVVATMSIESTAGGFELVLEAGIVPEAPTFATPAVLDLEHDGDLDLFVGGIGGGVVLFENLVR